MRPNETLIRQGETKRDLYVLLSGELSVRHGDQEIARITGQGEVVGELGAVTGQPRTATVVAVMSSEVLAVRNVTPVGLERLPKVLATIDAAITRRYSIAYNKNVMYRSTTATMRRMVLQESMREALQARRAPSVDESETRGILRHQVRQRIDERLAVYPDADDPKVLDHIAADYGVQDGYREKLGVRPWLNDSLVRRLTEIDSSWQLASEHHGAAAALEKARCAIDVMELLREYEAMPGIRREMDILRMEAIVPLRAKIETLKGAFFGRHLVEVEDERNRIILERRVKMAVEAAKADAGNDVVMIVQAARELEVEASYVDQIRNLVAMSETGTHFVDLSSAPVLDETVSRP